MSPTAQPADPLPPVVRPAAPSDSAALAQLFAAADRRFASVPAGDLSGLLASAPALVLAHGPVVRAVAVTSTPSDGVVWLRGLALDNRLAVGATLDQLLPPLHALLQARGVRRAYYAGDDTADAWLRMALRARGYAHDTDVIVYEKTRMGVPTTGSAEVVVRQVTPADVAAVLAVDAACFSVEWRKDEQAIGAGLAESPHFLVAELQRRVVGYAFVTSHYGGRLVHLVRIGVLPELRGRAIGARLLYEMVAYATQVGADYLTLNTQAYNAAARRLYEWFGFRRTGEKQTVLRSDL